MISDIYFFTYRPYEYNIYLYIIVFLFLCTGSLLCDVAPKENYLVEYHPEDTYGPNDFLFLPSCPRLAFGKGRVCTLRPVWKGSLSLSTRKDS